MKSCDLVQELNNVVSNMDEKLVFAILTYAKNIKRQENRILRATNHLTTRLGIAKNKELYRSDYDFHSLDKEIEKDFYT